MTKKPTTIAVKNYDFLKAQDMTEMAEVLKNHIVKHKLYSNIKGKNYVEVEGWQFAGGMMGIMPRVVRIDNLSNEKEIKWMAEVELVNIKTTEIVSRGFAICSSQEKTKRSFDEYAVLSMAQTRAIGKAYRTCIAWVMKVAGYDATPMEEMEDVLSESTHKMEEHQEAITKIKKVKELKLYYLEHKGIGADFDKLINERMYEIKNL